ncbi:MAG: SPFH domain-containing protein [Caldilineaceae bacterium]|nr:SPFH domain-containing protein [Caldilineaceae bacterium]
MIHRFLSRPGKAVLLLLLPYLLLLGLVLLAQLLPQTTGLPTHPLWLGLRWLVWIIFMGGAYLGWRLTAPSQRPIWWYSWLGFAVYEMVGLLLVGDFLFITTMTQSRSSLALLGILFTGVAFLPYGIVSVSLAQRDPQLAQWTIWPHAALTLPLFLLSPAGLFGAAMIEMSTLVLPLLVAIVLLSLFGWQPAFRRSRHLYGGMVVCQAAYAINLAQADGPWAALTFLPWTLLGTVILSGPLILLPLWHATLVFVHRRGGAMWLRAAAQWRQALKQRLATLPLPMRPATEQAIHVPASPPFFQSRSGDSTMSEIATTPQTPHELPAPSVGPGLERLYKIATVLLAGVILGGLLLFVGRSAIYKIHEYERGLHLRGGRFLAIQEPGWHVQIPLVDTVIMVKVNERLGYVEQIEAMTSDNVTMFVSLQYTYRVTDPQQYALQVDDPERIVFEFVQGRLRDVVNTKAMAAVMNERALMNQEVMAALRDKESQYGVQFATVQLQNASPPAEVLTAIKDRMVAVQRQEQAQAEAAQQKTVADAQFYTAQKQAEAAAYEITKTAEAEAERIRLNTAVEQLAIRAMIGELEGKGELANKFIDYLIAQQLKENSKWIINGEGTPIVDLQ